MISFLFTCCDVRYFLQKLSIEEIFVGKKRLHIKLAVGLFQ